MSSNLMDTEPGGKNTPYESIKIHTNPTAKEPGQLGSTDDTTNNPTTLPANTNTTSTTHVTAAEKARFGQALSEQGGMSGHTAPDRASGSAKQAGGYGGTDSLVENIEGGDAAQSRRAQGYGGERDVRRDVGA
ncbi:hypothetical protein MPH_11993 [Macrophomina phaseolina MS6]|uniref:Uncharacterized protein n=1 Tax=Macrophomina phaseolina (strain MS6) TaxID=1126212 RepID=K2S2T6_MACPH|nr:hypothetical protein MPH_11993 [Macrophomina phaseolina MS6]